MQRSEDGGLTFDSPILVQDSLGAPLLVSDDKPWIAVDGFPASPHYGRVYVAWTRVTTLAPGAALLQIVLRHSDDRGATWSDLIPVSANLINQAAQPVAAGLEAERHPAS